MAIAYVFPDNQLEQITVSVAFPLGRAEHAGHAADVGGALHRSRTGVPVGFLLRQGRRITDVPGSGNDVTANDVS